MNLDIQTTVTVIFLLLLLAAGGILFSAVRAFREARRLRFFLKRREILSRAWRLLFFAVLVTGGAIIFNLFAEPVTYQVFEPSPTITPTATITVTPTITITPTITQTPTMTPTLEFTLTPIMPAPISDGFTSDVTPNPDARFSPLLFARRLNGDRQPVDPSDRFDQPNTTLYGAFSYENMIPGSQWTALWFREGELISYESIPWDGASGGYGFTDLTLPAEEWLPGFYEVQIFAGETWKSSGTFEVFGEPPEPTITSTVTSTFTPTNTQIPTESPVPTETQAPTATVLPTGTPVPTETSAPTATPLPTQTPTETPVPEPTRRSTIAR